MKAKVLGVVKPTAMTWSLLILLILAQFLLGYSVSLDGPGLITAGYGIGRPVVISFLDGVRQGVRLDWAVMIVNLAGCYLVSAVAVALVKRVTGLRKPFRVYGWAVLGTLFAAFLGSVLLSRSYWGYYFRRPGVLKELTQLSDVSAVLPVKTVQTAAGDYQLVSDPDYSVEDHIAYAREDPYYNLDERILVYLDAEGLLPAATARASAHHSDLYALLTDAGLLAQAQDGYTSAGLLSGVIVEGHTASGRKLVFLGATGRQVSNDHYPCYEAVFEEDPITGTLTFVRGQRFFFDVAGMEGAEWYVVWLMASPVGLLLAFLLTTVTVGVRNTVRATRGASSAS